MRNPLIVAENGLFEDSEGVAKSVIYFLIYQLNRTRFAKMKDEMAKKV
jgi:hypothetical protein